MYYYNFLLNLRLKYDKCLRAKSALAIFKKLIFTVFTNYSVVIMRAIFVSRFSLPSGLAGVLSVLVPRKVSILKGCKKG